jgi:arylformamidase
MPIYDVTVPVCNELPTWPGDPGVQIDDWRILSKDGANVSGLCFGAHTGTHVDAPAHFIEGAAKVESLPLDSLIGEAEVIEVPRDRLAPQARSAFFSKRATPRFGVNHILSFTTTSRIST